MILLLERGMTALLNVSSTKGHRLHPSLLKSKILRKRVMLQLLSKASEGVRCVRDSVITNDSYCDEHKTLMVMRSCRASS